MHVNCDWFLFCANQYDRKIEGVGKLYVGMYRFKTAV